MYARTPTSILEEVIRIIFERGKTHGNYDHSMRSISDLWHAADRRNRRLPSEDVALKMALVKLGRMDGGTFNMDDYLDAIGYLAIAAALAAEKEVQNIVDRPSDTE